MNIPFRLIRHHRRMITTLLAIGVQSKLRKRPQRNPEAFAPVIVSLPAPDNRLVDYYRHWCGAPTDKYRTTLPPHLFSQFALPVCAQQLRQMRYDLSGIINQGCALTVHRALQRNAPIQVRCELVSVREDNGKASIHQHLQVSAASGELAYAVDFHTTLIIGPRQRRPRTAATPIDWQTVGSWSASARAGWEFALLTGDFNPLHWLRPLARLTPFRGTILHGFGMFARTFELIETQLQQPLTYIDVRFVSPLRLPTDEIIVRLGTDTDTDGCRSLQQTDADGKVQMTGRVRLHTEN